MIKITNTRKTGAYALLTLKGTIVVDNTLASCYAAIDDHRLVYTTLAPLRLLHNLPCPDYSEGERGKHIAVMVPRLMETMGRMVMDEIHFHQSTFQYIVRKD